MNTKKLLKILVGIGVGVSLLILLLPILINGLLSIDCFSSIVKGGESDWLSFYGSYLGGILGGLLTLVGVIGTIMYQDNLRNLERVEKQKVGVDILDNSIDEFYSVMTLILEILKNERTPDYEVRELILTNSKALDKFSNKFSNIPWDVIPNKYFEQYIVIKTNIQSVKELFESKDFHYSLNGDEIVDSIKEKKIKDSLKTIMESHSKFKKHSDNMEGLQKAIEEGGY